VAACSTTRRIHGVAVDPQPAGARWPSSASTRAPVHQRREGRRRPDLP
jgi:hypothetical protein